jgi:hypothetical protein
MHELPPDLQKLEADRRAAMEEKLAAQLSLLESERQALKQENEQMRANLDKRPPMPAQPQVHGCA